MRNDSCCGLQKCTWVLAMRRSKIPWNDASSAKCCRKSKTRISFWQVSFSRWGKFSSSRMSTSTSRSGRVDRSESSLKSYCFSYIHSKGSEFLICERREWLCCRITWMLLFAIGIKSVFRTAHSSWLRTLRNICPSNKRWCDFSRKTFNVGF